ncbi:unnamed protein product [Sympodiomycopsis kandeliae]
MTSTLHPPRTSTSHPRSSSSNQPQLSSISRTISHLESTSFVHTEDPSILLFSLQSLESKLKHLRSSSYSNTSEIDSLSKRLRNLILQCATLQSQQQQHEQKNDSSRLEMEQFLYSNIHSSRQATNIGVKLPPIPRFIVNANVFDNLSESLENDSEQQKMEKEGLEEYESASHLRKRTGFTSQEEEEQKQSTTTKVEKQTKSESSDRATHENLSGELLRMASILKNQSISFSEALERDRILLSSTDEHLAQNLDLMTRTRGRLGDYAAKARGMGWLTLGTIVVVILTWVVMFVIIKLT